MEEGQRDGGRETTTTEDDRNGRICAKMKATTGRTAARMEELAGTGGEEEDGPAATAGATELLLLLRHYLKKNGFEGDGAGRRSCRPGRKGLPGRRSGGQGWRRRIGNLKLCYHVTIRMEAEM